MREKFNYLKSTTRNLLDTDHVKRQECVKGGHCIDHHLGEKVLLLVDQLAIEGGTSTLLQDGPQLNLVIFVDLRKKISIIFDSSDLKQGSGMVHVVILLQIRYFSITTHALTTPAQFERSLP